MIAGGRPFLLFGSLVALVAACASSSSSPSPHPIIHASSYDQSCTVDAECIAVADGDVCDACHWNDDSCSAKGVIALHEKQRYTSDRAALHATCDDHGPVPCTTLCQQVVVKCVDLHCRVCDGTTSCSASGDAGSD